MKTLRIICLLVGSTVFVSCEQEVDKVLISEPRKLVVSGFISPADDSIRLYLSWSRPYYGANDRRGNPKDLSTAVVTISEGNTVKNLIWNNKANNFILPASQFILKPGGTYGLKVTAPDGTVVNASTTIPALPDQVSFNREEIRQKGGADEPYRVQIFRFAVKDPPGTGNFYRFNLYTRVDVKGIINLGIADEKWLTDKQADGKTVEAFLEYTEFTGSGSTPRTTDYIFEGYFITSGYEYYEFHQSLLRNNLSEDNPFAEPALVYSNITGGYGIFAGYNFVKITQTYKP